MAGHRHQNVVTPFPSPDPDHPERGFWEVETVSLRDFPQQLCAWEILRNSDNSISILTTSVDPVIETNSPAWNSRTYGLAAERIFGRIAFDDTSSRSYNVELVKYLSPAMQEKIADIGEPLGHSMHIESTDSGMAIDFLGQLQSSVAMTEPITWNDVSAATSSPYSVSAQNGRQFYRTVEP